MRKFLILVLSIMLVCLILTGAYIAVQLSYIDHKPFSLQKEVQRLKEYLGIVDGSPEESATGVTNILLLGIDRRTTTEVSRSDVMMIASIDKKNKQLKLTSLMRDMYIPIPDKGSNRINTAYQLGGPALSIKTVNTNFDLDITRYAIVDFFALEHVIDIIGGIEIELTPEEVELINLYIDDLNRLDETDKRSPYIKDAGTQLLDGRQAVAYTRIRYTKGGDFQRTKRQRTVLDTMFKKLSSTSKLKYPDLLASILPYVETNISRSEILNLGARIATFKNREILQYRIPVDKTFKEQKIRGMDVLVPDIDENKRLLHEFIYGR